MKKSHCCNATWHWKQISGIRLYRMVKGRKRYEAMCEHCGTYYDNLTPAGGVRLPTTTGQDDQ